MTVHDYWIVVRRSWPVVGLATVVGLVLAFVLSSIITPVYQAESQLFVSASSDEISGSYTGDLYVRERIESYLSLVDTPRVLDPVIDSLGLEMTRAELAGLVDATNPPETVLIQVLAEDGSATRAAAIGDATAESLSREIARLETTESGGEPIKAQLISPAQVPSAPKSPRMMFNLALGALLGLLAGAGASVLRATMDSKIRSVEDLQHATKGTVLGTVPRGSDPGTALDTSKDPVRAEAFRALGGSLRFVDLDNPPRCIVVTSAEPEKGKSATAVGLAVVLAESGASVLLVGADLRLPRAAEILSTKLSPGLTDVLISRASPHQHVARTIVSWRGLLDFLPSGTIPPNPGELLGSQQFADLLAHLCGEYDVVILDAPPLLSVSDAAILSAVADGVILVAQRGVTRHDKARQAAEALAGVGGRLLGTVFLGVPKSRRGSRHSYNGGTAISGRRPVEAPAALADRLGAGV